MRYVAMLEHGPTSWGAYVPDLPGCVAVGGSREEVEALIREAIAMHVEAMQADGDPLPTPTTPVAPPGVAPLVIDL
jgi:predicted RNase H-like HicB family nuclease